MNRETLLKNTGSFHNYLINSLRDKKKAAAYLQVALEEYQDDGDLDFFLMGLRNVAEAQGGIGVLAGKTTINRQHLYNALSEKGNPRLDTMCALLKGLGFRLFIATDKKRKGKAA